MNGPYLAFLREALEAGRGRYSTIGEAHHRFGIPFAQVLSDFEALKRAVNPRRRAIEERLERLRSDVARIPSHLASWVLPLVHWRERRRVPHPRRDLTKTPVSVVILSYQRRRLIEMTLNCLWSSAAGSNLEVIVVDNGSNATVVDYLCQAVSAGLISKLLLSSRNLGIPTGYNLGFASANEESEIHMKLDQDIQILTPGWLDLAVDLFRRHEQLGIVGINQVNHFALRTAPRTAVDGVAVIDWHHWMVGSAMLIHRRARDKLGWFNQDHPLKYFPDDVDYFLRLSRAGLRAYYLADFFAFHGLKPRQVWPFIALWPDPSTQLWGPLMMELARRYDTRERSLFYSYPELERAAVRLRRPGIHRV